jgi:DNA helicase HerA-like ATPase
MHDFEFEDNLYLGKRGFEPVGLSHEERLRHLYVIGQTGTGKSTLLLNLITQDLLNGHGVALLDPHGDLAESVLRQVPSWRGDDLVYFNPADLERPIGFNLLSHVPPDQRPLVSTHENGRYLCLAREAYRSA